MSPDPSTDAPITLPLLCFNDVYRVTQRYVPQPGAPPHVGDGDKITVGQFGQLVRDLRGTWDLSPAGAQTNGCVHPGHPGRPGGGAGSSSSSGRDAAVAAAVATASSALKNVNVNANGGDDSGSGSGSSNGSASATTTAASSTATAAATATDLDTPATPGTPSTPLPAHVPSPPREGLVLFAGDVFNPSVESAVTRGSHMVPVLNMLEVDCACIGNHDFDFGYPHLTKLLDSTTFPWLLSNIYDEHTGKSPAPLRRYWVTERCGVKIGVIGLVEEDWIATIPSWPENFRYRSMREVGLELSKELRDPQGEAVDLIIALTHCRVPNDIQLCNELGAVARDGVADTHGIDLVIGGHDHMYYIGNGATWDGYTGDHTDKGVAADVDCLLIKSGTDFRDLSEASLELAHHPDSIRRRTISRLTGKHHYILPDAPSSVEFDELVASLLSTVGETLAKPVAYTLTPFDARSEIVRTRETGLGNWIADVLLHAYAESLQDRKEAADAVIICGGGLRGDSQYGPGKVTLGDILEILPFEDPVVCIEIDGKGIWEVMESALSKWPAQEGRFPIVSGLAVVWDHALPPGQRVKSIHTVRESEDDFEDPLDLVEFVEQDDGTKVEVKQRRVQQGDPIEMEKTYRVITRDYMAQGYDGYESMKGRKFIIDDENGQIMSSIIRSFLLGSSYIYRHKDLMDAHEDHLSKRTDDVLHRARARASPSPSSSGSNSPRAPSPTMQLHPHPHPHTQHPLARSHGPDNLTGHGEAPDLAQLALRRHPSASEASGAWSLVRRHVVKHDRKSIRDALFIGRNEHMSGVDSCAGDVMRSFTPGRPKAVKLKLNKLKPAKPQPQPQPRREGVLIKDELKELGAELAIVCPLVDGRLRDVAV